MDAAIRLNDELDGRTTEVSDVRTERHLSSETQTIHSTFADVDPQRLLGPRKLLALATS